MILSICIPIYNTDIRPIATELHRQLKEYSSEVELLFLDDASDVFFKEINRSVGRYSDYQELPENVGRSKIRNAFLPFVKGTFILFIDGDSEVISTDFIQQYVNCLRIDEHDVLIGASIYSEQKPIRKQLLRWTYSRKRESKKLRDRLEYPEQGFTSNNFVIRKSLVEKYPFDETLTTYGHEDTLFGYNLSASGVRFHHIDNPVLNSNLDENQEFLEKTKLALQNLLSISFKLQDANFNQGQHLLSLALRIEKNVAFRFVIKILDPLCLSIITKCLRKGYFILWMFDFYRLAHLMNYLAQDRKNKAS